MALEPAFALVIGFLALSQVPNGTAVVGILLVVAAGIGAERTGDRAVPAASQREPVTA
jgi:inner membrane transporter RhtA